MAITDYQIVAATSVAELNTKAGALVLAGHAPIGGVFQRGPSLCQAVGAGTVDVGSSTSYVAIAGSTLEDLQERVNAVLDQENQPLSGPMVRGNSIVQTLGKITPIVSPE